MQRGEIYTVDLSPGNGREFSGPHAVVVLSCDRVIATQWMIVFVPGVELTGILSRYGVVVPAVESGLSVDLRFVPNQIRSLDFHVFLNKAVGNVPAERMLEIERKLKLELDIH